MTKLVTLQTGNRGLGGVSRRTFGSIALSSLVLLPRPGRAQGSKPTVVPTETLDLKKFAHPTEITNKWIPLKPGTRWTYDGTTVEDDGKVVPHQIVHTVTDMTKKIDGIRTVITYDLDISDNELAEAELSFFAQDDDRNVWHFGEYPEVMEDGNLKDTPLWIHGFEGSKAGIMRMFQAQEMTGLMKNAGRPSVGPDLRVVIGPVFAKPGIARLQAAVWQIAIGCRGGGSIGAGPSQVGRRCIALKKCLRREAADTRQNRQHGGLHGSGNRLKVRYFRPVGGRSAIITRQLRESIGNAGQIPFHAVQHVIDAIDLRCRDIGERSTGYGSKNRHGNLCSGSIFWRTRRINVHTLRATCFRTVAKSSRIVPFANTLDVIWLYGKVVP